MIITQEQKKRIRATVRKHYNWLLFKMTGKDYLTDQELNDLIDRGLIIPGEDGALKEAYYAGRGRHDVLKLPHERDDISFDEYLRNVKPKALPISDVQKYALEHIEESAGSLIVALGDKTRNAVEQIINNANLEERNRRVADEIIPVLREGIEKQKTINQIASDLRDKTGDLLRDWKRVSLNEISTASSLGAIDAIAEDNKDKSPDEIYIYMAVNLDGALCQSCRKFYLLPGTNTPRIFKLSELQGAGTNYGKKVAEYNATIPPLHVQCRCTPLGMPNGFGFDDFGRITFKGSDYIAFKEQK